MRTWLKRKLLHISAKAARSATRLDTAALVKTATKSGKMNLVREHDFLCSAEGVAMIKNDIENEGVTHAALCACSRRAKTEAFNFPTIAMSRGNLREGVIWIRPDTEEARETTQEMAEDYVRMACAEVKAMTVPPGNQKTGSVKTLLVVGGGMSGMTSALEASKAGYKVVLVEKSGALGGWAAKLHKRVPTREPFKAPEDNGVADMAARIEADSNIKVYLNATIAKTDGAPGRFKVEIAVESGAIAQEDIGAIIQATGFTLYDANKLPEFGYGKTPNVVDQAGLEALAKAAAADGKPITPSVRRPAGQVGGVRAVRRPARRHRHASAVLLRLLLQHQHQAGDVLQGQQPGHRHRGAVHRPAHPGQRRGLLPRRAEQGRDLLQGRGVASHPQRQQLHGQVQGPDPERRHRSAGRPGGAGHRHGADLRRQHRRPVAAPRG